MVAWSAVRSGLSVEKSADKKVVHSVFWMAARRVDLLVVRWELLVGSMADVMDVWKVVS